MDVGAGFHGRGFQEHGDRAGGSICAAELVSALQNIGQRCNLFVCYSHCLGPHHFLKLDLDLSAKANKAWQYEMLETGGKARN